MIFFNCCYRVYWGPTQINTNNLSVCFSNLCLHKSDLLKSHEVFLPRDPLTFNPQAEFFSHFRAVKVQH